MPPFVTELLIGLTRLAVMQFRAAPGVALRPADPSIRSLTILRTPKDSTARTVVTAEPGEALGVRVGNAPRTMAAGPGRKLRIFAPTPPAGVPCGFAVVVRSAPPKPRQASDFAERVLPNP